MTVFELIALLRTFPPTTPVVLSSDPEGNSFAPVYQVSKEKGDDLEDLRITLPARKSVAVLWPA
jgi:hypothetical protein